MQLLESLIPPLTAAALRIIVCKMTVPHFDNQEKDMKSAFLRPNEKRCVLSVKKSNFTEKNDQNFAYGQLRADRDDRKILVFFDDLP